MLVHRFFFYPEEERDATVFLGKSAVATVQQGQVLVLILQTSFYLYRARCFMKFRRMTMMNGVHAALSGLQALTTRIEKNANNVANMQTQEFKKDRVVLSERYPQGVEATVEKVTSPGSYVAEMTERGYDVVEQSNVDLVEEIPELLLNKNGFSANLKTLETADQMTRSLLDIKA